MAVLKFLAQGEPDAAYLHGAAAEAALREIGVECGRLPLQAAPVSSMPQLTYARELLALQRRFGGGRIERVRSRVRHDPRTEAVAQMDDEVCVVLEGALRYGLHTRSQQALLSVEAGEWVALPRGLQRTCVTVAEPALDLLRLHA